MKNTVLPKYALKNLSLVKSTTSKYKIDVSDWMPVLYFLILETAEGKSVKKVVKM